MSNADADVVTRWSMGSFATCRMVDVDTNAARKLLKGNITCFECIVLQNLSMTAILEAPYVPVMRFIAHMYVGI